MTVTRSKHCKYVLITDVPTPWREKVYERVYKRLGDDFHVVYCARKEERRLWRFPMASYPRTFLKSLRFCVGEKERWLNLNVVSFLFKHKPKVVICFSLQPTIFVVFFIAKILRSKIGILSDAWLERDGKISWIQKFGRKAAYSYFGDAFIGASRKTLEMFKHYNKNAREDSFFLSWLCADNEYFEEYLKGKNLEREFDLMFSGRIVEIKNPMFFACVAKRVKEQMGRCKVLIIGEGDERIKKDMFKALRDAQVEYEFAGFVEHSRLPEYYSSAKVFLFPTSGDCWGVVINEALLSGMPVITTDMTAAAGELVVNGENGFVLPLDSKIWAEKICFLLKNQEKFAIFSLFARQSVEKYNFVAAADGITESIEYLARDNSSLKKDSV